MSSRAKLAKTAVTLLASGGLAFGAPGLAHADDLLQPAAGVGAVQGQASCDLQGGDLSGCTTIDVSPPTSDGGIDLQAYCDTLGLQAKVVLADPQTPYDWGCLYIPLGRPGLPGNVPVGLSSDPPVVPNWQGANVDFNAACREQYGDNTMAVLTDPNDVRSWRCYSLDLGDMA